MEVETEDGRIFIKHLAYFVRTHEKALANALQVQRQSLQSSQSATSTSASASQQSSATPSSSASNAIAAALSLPYLNYSTQNVKPVKLTLTPHHLFYLLSRFEELGISVGPMNVRLEHVNSDVLPGSYVSFLGSGPKSRGKSDADSIHSVSSVRSVMSSMSSMWSKLGLTSKEDSKLEKQKAVEKDDLKYLYSAFTKIPCLRLAPDHRSKPIAGYREFPFDTAVPLFAFKNISALEICDLDFRQMFGWDRLSEQLRSLTIKRGCVEDVADLLVHIVLDDMEKRRRRSYKSAAPSSPATPWPAASPGMRHIDPTSPLSDMRRSSIGSPSSDQLMRKASTDGKRPAKPVRRRSPSPHRPSSSRQNTAHVLSRSATPKLRRASGSDSSSVHSTPRNSSSNLLSLGYLQPSKWRFLRHLSLADNGMTFILAAGLAPLAGTLQSLDLSSNLFTEIPDSLATLTNLRALNLSNCMITSLHSLGRNPLPAITVLNLHSNRLVSLAGIEKLFSLERLDLRNNKLADPTELARLTRIPDMQHIYTHRNPFTRTHSNYRITIFNLFRHAPGYTEDVTLDSTAPTFTEKKYLNDRVIEQPSVPVLGKNDGSPPLTARDRSLSDAAKETPRASGATQRRKAPRRRIVELSEGTTSPPNKSTAPQQSQNEDDSESDSDSNSEEEDSPTKTITAARPHDSVVSANQGRDPATLPALQTRLPSPSPNRTPELVTDEESPVRDSGETGHAYRQKIEALKSDLGPGWLTALNEDKWDRRQAGRGTEKRSARSEQSAVPKSRGVSVGQRTLG